MNIELPDPNNEILLPVDRQLTIFEEQPDYPLTDLTEQNAQYFRTIATTNLSPSGYSMLREYAPASANRVLFNDIIEAMQGKIAVLSSILYSDDMLYAWANESDDSEMNRIMGQRLAQTAQALESVRESQDNPEVWQAWVSGFLDQDHIRTTVNGRMPSATDGAGAIELIINKKAHGAGIQSHLRQATKFSDVLPRTYDLIVATSPNTMTVEQVQLRTFGAYLNYITTLSTTSI